MNHDHEDHQVQHFQAPMRDEDALLWMVLLHNYAIQFRPGTIDEDWAKVPALTQRHAATVLAALWPDRDENRASYEYWYFKYGSKTPYEVIESVPKDMMPRLLELRDKLSKDPRVAAIIEED
ncbi:MAG: hypothetical protein E6K70_02000 [Planctomycetota bacterium]|nr:MAG: hypothetical protein E6K70_02000 [Planctomycetota bacterium]